MDVNEPKPKRAATEGPKGGGGAQYCIQIVVFSVVLFM